MHKLWVNIVVALASLGVAYGFASLAIDSGSLLDYALAILFVGWAINRLVLGIRYTLGH